MTILAFFAFLLLSFVFLSMATSLTTSNTATLDASLRTFARKTIARNRFRTGKLYEASSPENLSGITVSILKIRSRGLWSKGANFSYFVVPPRTISLPHVRRLALVFHDLGNRSSEFYDLHGYAFVASIIGFTAFDASNSSSEKITNLAITTSGKAISVHFPGLSLTGKLRSELKCVMFRSDGTSVVRGMSSPGLCSSTEEGRFSVVVREKRRQRLWRWWLRGFGLGFAGLVVAGLAGFVLVKLLRTKKIQIMERQADEDLVFSSRWVGRSKMPSAQATRTQPAFEN